MFTATNYKGYSIEVNRQTFDRLIDKIADADINIRGLVVNMSCNNCVEAVVVPESPIKRILRRLSICYHRTNWVVVDNQPISGQLKLILTRLTMLRGLSFAFDETGQLAIITKCPNQVIKALAA